LKVFKCWKAGNNFYVSRIIKSK